MVGAGEGYQSKGGHSKGLTPPRQAQADILDGSGTRVAA